MPLNSVLLKGNARLEQVLGGARSVRRGVADDADAVGRIQRALAQLVAPMPRSFPSGPSGPPDGVFGAETEGHVRTFQRRAFPSAPLEWDGRVGARTLQKLDDALGGPAPSATFVCGPDVSDQVATTWARIQTDFAVLSRDQKIRCCDTVLFPVRTPRGIPSVPTSVEELRTLLQQFADIDGWDTLPLYQGASAWLRSPPVFDRATNGPCATPSSVDPAADDFDPSHELDTHCANTVQVGGKCWLNGTVNYGTFGIMARLCRDFAVGDAFLRFDPRRRLIYSLDWARLLIRAYKQFGPSRGCR